MSDRVTIEEGIAFGHGGGRELACDLFRPASGTAHRAGVLLVHGGAWQVGDRSQLRAYGIQLAREGFTCVSASYRLTPEAPWPAQIHDVKTAVRFMRARAEWLAIEPGALAAVGASAGGHLALLAAGTVGYEPFEGEGGHAGEDTSLRAVVGIFPPTLLCPRDAMEPGGVPALALLGDRDDAETARLASPLAHVSPSFPPTLLLHGNADRMVPAAASMRMYEALIDAGVPAELHMVAEQPHAYVLQRDFHRLSVQTIALFLRRYLGLRPPITLPSTVTGGPPR